MFVAIPNYLSHHLLSLKVHINMKKQSQDWDPVNSHMGCECSKNYSDCCVNSLLLVGFYVNMLLNTGIVRYNIWSFTLFAKSNMHQRCTQFERLINVELWLPVKDYNTVKYRGPWGGEEEGGEKGGTEEALYPQNCIMEK